eukprot:COSAG01_NODE_8300_length_2839_cov_1.632482_2_plen_255_part_00
MGEHWFSRSQQGTSRVANFGLWAHAPSAAAWSAIEAAMPVGGWHFGYTNGVSGLTWFALRGSDAIMLGLSLMAALPPPPSEPLMQPNCTVVLRDLTRLCTAYQETLALIAANVTVIVCDLGLYAVDLAHPFPTLVLALSQMARFMDGLVRAPLGARPSASQLLRARRGRRGRPDQLRRGGSADGRDLEARARRGAPRALVMIARASAARESPTPARRSSTYVKNVNQMYVLNAGGRTASGTSRWGRRSERASDR